MSVYYLSIGSNIEPEKYIPACLKKLSAVWPQARFSTVYETDPVGPAGRSKFWNLAARIQSYETESQMRTALREIEAGLGRVRIPNERFAPRTIDIDILPQAGYQTQAFIMIPLAEIAPADLDLETGLNFETLANRVREQAEGFKAVRF